MDPRGLRGASGGWRPVTNGRGREERKRRRKDPQGRGFELGALPRTCTTFLTCVMALSVWSSEVRERQRRENRKRKEAFMAGTEGLLKGCKHSLKETKKT